MGEFIWNFFFNPGLFEMLIFFLIILLITGIMELWRKLCQQGSLSQLYKLASRRRRFFAAIVDGIISFITSIVTGIIIFYLYKSYFFKESIPVFGKAVVSTSTIVFIILMFIITIRFLVNFPFLINGQTIGMRLLNIQVTDVHGNVASIWRIYFLREIIFWVVIYVLQYSLAIILHGFSELDVASVEVSTRLFSLIVFAIDLLFIYRSDRRCIHDYFAGTIVIKPQKEVFYKQSKKLSVFQKTLWSLSIICMSIIGTAFAVDIKSDYDFFELCKEGSFQQVVDAIENGANVNARRFSGETPLMLAGAYNPNPRVISALIKAGANVNANTMTNEGLTVTPLITATLNPNPEVITVLANAGADVNAKENKFGSTPLMIAAHSISNPEVIITLIKSGAGVNEKDNDGRTPLMVAASNNPNPEVISAFARMGTDVNVRDEDGWTPLMYATSDNSNPEVITTLLILGADPKAKDNSGKTALDYAMENDDLKNTDAIQMLEKVNR